MLIVRFRQTFRERSTEWVLAGMLTGWGFIVAQSPDVFDRPFYAPLGRIAPPIVWGVSALLIGLMRLAVLFINGAWWRTPFFRQIGCVFGLAVWSGLCMGALSVEWRSPGVGVYAGLFFLDALALSFAARDGANVSRSRGAGHGQG